MTTRPYDLLPKAAQQRIAQGLQALLECKQYELKILRQTTAITQAVMTHPTHPEKWPLRAPWPEGFVVQREDGAYVCLNRYRLPRAWSPLLAHAYVWSDRERAEQVAADRIGQDPHVLSVEAACAKVAE